jgi:hypothetical protein
MNRKDKIQSEIAISWGSPEDLVKNIEHIMENKRLPENYFIAKCGHRFHSEGIITYLGEKTLVKYRVLSGKPDYCHECLEKHPEVLNVINDGEIILSV